MQTTLFFKKDVSVFLFHVLSTFLKDLPNQMTHSGCLLIQTPTKDAVTCQMSYEIDFKLIH